MATRTCVYISERGSSSSPASDDTKIILETLVEPAVTRAGDFSVIFHDHEPGSISEWLSERLQSADLVVADLTELSASGYFELGVRQASGLPLVLMGQQDYVMATLPADFNFVRYNLEGQRVTQGLDELFEAIYLALRRPSRAPGGGSVVVKGTPEERRLQLADRIEETAEVIRLLRINSTMDAVADLQEIAAELKKAEDDKTPSALKEAAEGFLKVLSKITDQLSTTRGARLAISGGIALVVGGSGWPAITALGLTLAFWEGKDAFLKALELLNRGGKGQPKKKA